MQHAGVSRMLAQRVHTKVSLNVRHRVVSPTRIAERTASLEIRLKLLAHERVTRQPPTLDGGSTVYPIALCASARNRMLAAAKWSA